VNILFCYRNSFNPAKGGVQRVCDTLSKYFVFKGHSVYYLTYLREDNDNYFLSSNTFRLPDPVFNSANNLNFYNSLLETLSIDIIINHDATNDRSKFFLDVGTKSVKVISLYHQNPLQGIFNSPKSRFGEIIYKLFPVIISSIKKKRRRAELKYLISRSDRLVVLSEEFIIDLKIKLNLRSRKIISIGNPIKLGMNDNSINIRKRKQIIFVGRLEMVQKRPDSALRIWASLEAKFPEWELIFLGDGPDRAYVENLSNSLNLVHVKFKGFVDPLPFYRESSILCMTSDYEGFGLALAEAMQFGVVPIVFDNWSSLKDIIIHNETGLLIPQGDMAGYGENLELLMKDDHLRKRLSDNAKVFVRKFSIDEIGKKWLNLFNELAVT